jgi:hypothetical protein
MRWPTATSIAGSAGLTAAFAFGAALALPGFARALGADLFGADFLILLPPLTSGCFLHVHENGLQSPGKCDHNFILVKIGLNGLSRNSLV